MLWEHDVAGSNPVTPTKKPPLTGVVDGGFFLTLVELTSKVSAPGRPSWLAAKMSAMDSDGSVERGLGAVFGNGMRTR